MLGPCSQTFAIVTPDLRHFSQPMLQLRHVPFHLQFEHSVQEFEVMTAASGYAATDHADDHEVLMYYV
jgi:hypothetical protein